MSHNLSLSTHDIIKKYQHLECSEEITSLIHELSVYQIELEMQNESLKQTQEELLRSNVQFFNIYHQAPVGYVILDEKDVIIKANNQFLSMLDLAYEAVINKPLVNLFMGDSRLLIEYWLGRHELGQEDLTIDYIQEEQLKHFKIATNELSEWNGKPCKFLVFTDLTKEIELENFLMLSHAIINDANDACLVIDANHRIHFLNPAFESISGYLSSEIIGEPVSKLKSNRAFLNITDVARKLGSRSQWDGPVWIATKQGDVLSCQLNASIVNCDTSYYYVFRLKDDKIQDA
jgi:PAS domain S-box-containing protein